jgi:serine/threonine protein kinase
MQGRVKVADFGLAKAANENSGFTQSNMAVGTPDFVAPEALIAGMPVDGRADLYAVGVMTYQMLTGNVPRGAWHPASVMVPGVDPRFDQIIVKAMQQNRDARHSSATELRATWIRCSCRWSPRRTCSGIRAPAWRSQVWCRHLACPPEQPGRLRHIRRSPNQRHLWLWESGPQPQR